MTFDAFNTVFMTVLLVMGFLLVFSLFIVKRITDSIYKKRLEAAQNMSKELNKILNKILQSITKEGGALND